MEWILVSDFRQVSASARFLLQYMPCCLQELNALACENTSGFNEYFIIGLSHRQ